jgi:flagellar biosynthesis/type III secretory pathway protein FliH
MMKEINFNEMQQKLKKYKDDTESKLNEMVLKLKKKVGVTELS